MSRKKFVLENVSGDLVTRDGSQVSSGGLQTVTVSLTTNNINHPFSAPTTLVPAPGAGKANIVVSMSFAIHAGSSPFNSGSHFPSIFYGNASGTDFELDASVVFSSTSKVSIYGTSDWATQPSSGIGFSFTSIENKSITYTCSGDLDGTGNGSAKVTIYYYVLTLP